MIYAKLRYSEHYSEKHDEILSCLRRDFEKVEEGLQGDSWVWVFDKDDKVQIDTFTAMHHEVKCSNRDSILVGKVIDSLKKEFDVEAYDQPEFEPHE